MLHKTTSVPLGPCLVPLVTLENVKTTAQSCVERTDAHKRAGHKVCFAGFEDDVASIRMFYSMSNHMIHQESAQELSNHHRI